ncbi:hypothetical protein SB764_38815, partial [Paraburkholderia sp. SIMBA_027]
VVVLESFFLFFQHLQQFFRRVFFRNRTTTGFTTTFVVGERDHFTNTPNFFDFRDVNFFFFTFVFEFNGRTTTTTTEIRLLTKPERKLSWLLPPLSNN